MRSLMTAVCLVGCALATTLFAEDDDNKQKKQKESKDKAIVYSVRNSPASNIGRSLEQFFEGSQLRVISDSQSNVLLIQTPQNNHERVFAVLQQLDRTPSLVKIQVQLLKAEGERLSQIDVASLSGQTAKANDTIKQLVSSGRVRVANRMELTVIESHKSLVQVGESIPVVSGSSISSSRGRTNAYRHVDVGTMFTVQAKVASPSDVIVDLQFEKSEVPPTLATSTDEPLPAPGVSQLTQTTTIRVRDGFSELISAFVSESNDLTSESYLVLSVAIQKPNAATTATASRPDSATDKATDPRLLGARAALDRAATLARDPRYLQYYEKLLAKYDQDGDNALNADERSKMTKDCSKADTDGDGLVTAAELTEWSLRR